MEGTEPDPFIEGCYKLKLDDDTSNDLTAFYTVAEEALKARFIEHVCIPPTKDDDSVIAKELWRLSHWVQSPQMKDGIITNPITDEDKEFNKGVLHNRLKQFVSSFDKEMILETPYYDKEGNPTKYDLMEEVD